MKTVLFDMDGLIFDTERLGIELSLKLAKKNHILLTEEACLSVIGTDEKTTEKMLKGLFTGEYTYWDLYEEREILVKEYMSENKIPMKKGVRSLLEKMKKAEIPMGLVTSSYLNTVKRYLDQGEITEYFDQITTGDEVEESKPNPEIYLLAAKKMETSPSNCIVLEDSYNGLIAGKKAGMTTVMIPDLKPFTQEISPYVDACFSSLKEGEEYIIKNATGKEEKQ